MVECAQNHSQELHHPSCVSVLCHSLFRRVGSSLYCSLPFLCFWEVAVVSKPTFYGKLRAGVFTKCFQTATKIQDSHGLFPSRILKLFCCGCTHVKASCRPGAPAAQAMLRCPPVPGEQGLAWGRRARTAWQPWLGW